MKNFYRKSPDYNLIKVFGCLCCPYVAHFFAHKFLSWSKACFLSVSPQNKEFKYLDPSTNRIILSRHVHFKDFFFPYNLMFPAKTRTFAVSSSQTTSPIFSPIHLLDKCASPTTNFDFISRSDITYSPLSLYLLKTCL